VVSLFCLNDLGIPIRASWAGNQRHGPQRIVQGQIAGCHGGSWSEMRGDLKEKDEKAAKLAYLGQIQGV